MANFAPPPPVADRSAWTREELARDTTWRLRVPAGLRCEVARRTRAGAGVPLTALAPVEVLGDELCAWLDASAAELADGRGVLLIEGLPAAELSDAEGSALVYALGAVFGRMRTQNAAGDLVGRVEDRGNSFADPDVRGYTTPDELRPHSDGCDVLGLLCMRPALAGGENAIVSSMAIYDRLAAETPELLSPLFRGFYNDLRGEKLGAAGDGLELSRWPVFVHHQGVLSCGFNPKTIRNAPRKSGVPLSELEQRALQAMERLADDESLSYRFTLGAGDAVFLNNLTTLHSRTAYQDHAELARKRLLLRVWLNSDRPRPLPDSAASLVRGGIAQNAPGVA